MKINILILLFAFLSFSFTALGEIDLEQGFRNPPTKAKPSCYWYWLNDNVSKEGITKDLEAMARAGIAEAYIGNIDLNSMERGDVSILSEEWWAMVEHAVREGERVGVDIALFNCPGWSQSGGPWITPEEAMRYLAVSESRVQGPVTLDRLPPVPGDDFQDVALIAFRAPKKDNSQLIDYSPKVASPDTHKGLEALIDGDRATSSDLTPNSKGEVVIDITLDRAITARSLSLYPADEVFMIAECELLIPAEKGEFVSVGTFTFDRAPSAGFGPITLGEETYALPAIESDRFRLVVTNIQKVDRFKLAEIDISEAARLDAYIEKQLGKVHTSPIITWDAYQWPNQEEPDASELIIPYDTVIDLTSHVGKNGELSFDLGVGEWVIQRLGMMPTSVKNGPAAPHATGLEVDKINRAATRNHFEAYVGKLLERMPVDERKALKRVVADSYEMGPLNWTDGMQLKFKERYGYDPLPWLPVLSGRIVNSAKQSDRFLWDLRRLVADLVATEYVGGLREKCEEYGLTLWLENYGHWGFPGEFLKYGSLSHSIGGEFWMQENLGTIECRAASSCGNTYNKPVVSAEAFTSNVSNYYNAPWNLKNRGDWAFAQGINHIVLHVYIHQPDSSAFPGVTAWFGTEFHRQNTWFEPGKAWLDYLKRSSFLLQQGHRVADVAYFISEDTPKMTGIVSPELPRGYDYDFINGEVILNSLEVEGGLLTLPHGTTYRVLVLPSEIETMRPELLEKIERLVAAGATIHGLPPKASPSLQNYPACDQIVQRLARDLWGNNDFKTAGMRVHGQGKVFWNMPLEEVFERINTLPDFQGPDGIRYSHRSINDADIYFVANANALESVQTELGFRTQFEFAEFWWPTNGYTHAANVSRSSNEQKFLEVDLAPNESFFVIFRDRQSAERDAYLPWKSDKKHRVTKITTPWTVRFDTKWGGPESVVFKQLEDWATHKNESVRYYSGKAVYENTFKLSSRLVRKETYLDLGSVGDIVEVSINGKKVGTLWTEPWKIDITDYLRTGRNELSLTVTNTWYNRLIGDSQLPEADRLTRKTGSIDGFKALTPKSSGLIGPVKIVQMEESRH